MAGNIKGITIEIGGNTTNLQKALKDVNKETRSIQNELKYVDRALKLDPKNVDLLRQKQTLLARSVEATKNKLEILKQAQEKASRDMEQGIEVNQEEYRRLQREIVETTEQLNNFQRQSALVNTSIGQFSTQATNLGNNLVSAGQALSTLSAVSAGVVAGMVALGFNAGSTADDINTLSKVTGIATDKLQALKYAEDFTDVSTETIAKSMQKLTRNMDSARNGSKEQEKAFKQLGVSVVDVSGKLRDNEDVFYDSIRALQKIENEAERDAIAMKLFGKSAQELNPLIEGGIDTLEQYTRQFKELGIVIDQETLDKANKFKDKVDELKVQFERIGQIFGTKVAEALLPHMDNIINAVGKIAEVVANMDPILITVIGTVGGLLALLAPVLTTIGQISLAIGVLTGKFALFGTATAAAGATAGTASAGVGALGASFLALLGPIALAVVAVGLMTYAIIQVYEHWEELKEAFSAHAQLMEARLREFSTNWVLAWTNIKNGIKRWVDDTKKLFGDLAKGVAEKFENFKKIIIDKFKLDKIKEKIQDLFDFFKDIWDKITGFFKKPLEFPEIKRPKIPVPNLSISGKFSLNPPEMPKISAGIKWYAQGGIFNAPSIIGVGEAGKEAVLPIDRIDDIMAKAIDKTGNNEVLYALLNEIKLLRQDTKNMPYVQRNIARQGVI